MSIFLIRDIWGTLAEFKNRIFDNSRSRQSLSEKVSPFLLRRLKSQVAPQLPPKSEEILYLPLSNTQERMYQDELAKVRANLPRNGAMEILAALTRLRQICSHPHLLSARKSSDQPKIRMEEEELQESSKLEFLVDHLLELREEGHSALIFSQFTTMLDIIETTLNEQSVSTYKITGATPVSRRAQIVDQFQNNADPSVFLLSLKAAGTGLTLTKADYVYIYDPWWNPAAENQAIDRTHRIGQDKPVIAYRLVAANTIEEKIMKLKEEKQQLFSQVIDGTTTLPSNLKVDDLITILSDG